MRTSDVVARAESEKVKFVQLQFMDILGTVKNVTIPARMLEKALEEGIFFDGSSVLGYATIEESDMRLIPEPNTWLLLPWTTGNMKTARLICNVYSMSKRFEGDPRYILEKVLGEAKKIGYTSHMGPEYEFFLFLQTDDGKPTTKPSDFGTYFDLMRDRGDDVRKKILMHLETMGFDVEASHHEVAPGQHEIDLSHADALTTADRVALMKYVTKRTAEQHNLYATFMPKPLFRENGSGMHVHQSLITKNGKNLFYDPNGEYELSNHAFYYLGFLLKFAKETCAVLASWVNSYKRLVPGYEAPTYISWANKNRSALIRVPAGRGMRTRVEVRNPDPAGNPYLQFALMLQAGLEGIKKKLQPPKPLERDLYKISPSERKKLGVEPLPANLGHALSYMEKSDLVRDTLGEHLFRHYLHIKREEWNEYRARVMEWEVEKFLPTL